MIDKIALIMWVIAGIVVIVSGNVTMPIYILCWVCLLSRYIKDIFDA